MASMSRDSDLEIGLQLERQLPIFKRLSKQMWEGVVALFGGGMIQVPSHFCVLKFVK
eukprot:c21920_g1_i1 orf=3-170(-)